MSALMAPTITAMEDDTVRTVDLIAAPALDERAVQEFARAMRTAVDNATEVLGGTTRRESELSISDILEPSTRSELDELVGTMLALRGAGTTLGVLHLDDAQTVALADLFLGGPGTGEDRPAADIELHVIGRSMGPILQPIVSTATFTTVDQLDIVVDRDLNGLAAYLVRTDLTMKVGGVEVTAGVYVRDPDRAGPATDAMGGPVVTASAATMPIELDIELASVDMPAADIGTLAVGDVVIFDVPADAPATARHEATTLFEGQIHYDDDRRLLEVTSVRTA